MRPEVTVWNERGRPEVQSIMAVLSSTCPCYYGIDNDRLVDHQK